MFRNELKRLMEDFGIKQKVLFETMRISKVTFMKKMEDNSFTENEKKLIYMKYGGLM